MKYMLPPAALANAQRARGMVSPAPCLFYPGAWPASERSVFLLAVRKL